MRVLLLGGTSEARELAAELIAKNIEVTSSLAGRVAKPRLPVGAVRIGGFGGVEGLRATLSDFDVVIDATHPFALGMSANAVAACVGRTPLLRLERPGWPIDPAWQLAPDHEQAAQAAAAVGSRPFITVGRQELSRFIPLLADRAVVARVVDAPEVDIPQQWHLILSRGPYTEEGERRIMTEHRCDVLITKNSGGSYTWPKMAVAQELGIPVIVIDRPEAPTGVAVVNTVVDALDWLEQQR